MAQVTEHVSHIVDGAGAFDGSWTYDDVSGDLLSVAISNTTTHAYNVRVEKVNNVNTFTVAAGFVGTRAVPGKKYSFVKSLAPDGELEWGPNFTFSVFRA